MHAECTVTSKQLFLTINFSLLSTFSLTVCVADSTARSFILICDLGLKGGIAGCH